MTTTTSAVVARPTRSLPAAALWTLGFLAFPVAGVAGTAVAGPLDAPVAALLGGLTTGAVIGLGQALVSTRRLAVLRWTFATAVGTAAGLLLGASTVSYATGLADLAVMGALTGAVLGPVQALALPARARHRWIWAAAMPPVWAAGWSVTAAAGIAVERAVHGLRRQRRPHGHRAARRMPPPAPAAHGFHAERANRPDRRDPGPVMITTAPRHVIFGTGAIGMALLDALRERGEAVRMVNRSGRADVPDGVEVVGGDAGDPAFSAAAAAGARVVYQTLNPPYHQWAQQFPLLQAGVLAAAQANRARLVSMENVYMYGRPDGRPLTEDRAHEAAHPQGRAALGDVARSPRRPPGRPCRGRRSVGHRTTSGPGAARSPTSGTGSSRPPSPGGRPPSSATRTSRTATPSCPTSVRDSRPSVSIRMHPVRSGTCPTTRTPARPVSSSDTVYRLAGRPRARLRTVPSWALRVLAVANATVSELVEMQYQFEEPFVVDSTRISTRLGVRATPLDQALERTLRTYPDPRVVPPTRGGRRPSAGRLTRS